jgi:predicted RNA-binding Zn-ribbon protein involved in translation (DUF1610 family)
MSEKPKTLLCPKCGQVCIYGTGKFNGLYWEIVHGWVHWYCDNCNSCILQEKIEHKAGVQHGV